MSSRGGGEKKGKRERLRIKKGSQNYFSLEERGKSRHEKVPEELGSQFFKLLERKKKRVGHLIVSRQGRKGSQKKGEGECRQFSKICGREELHGGGRAEEEQL